MTKLLQRAAFDSPVERGQVKKTLKKSQHDAVAIRARLAEHAIVLFVIITEVALFSQNPIRNCLHAVIACLPLVFVAIVVIETAVAAAAKPLIQNSPGGLSCGTLVG